MQPNPKPKTEPETRIVPTETPLERVIEEVRSDAAQKPDVYARETIVPEGGE